LAILIAVVLHAAAFSAMVTYGESQIGGRGVYLDAISIEVSLVPATAVESRTPKPDAAAGSPAPVEITEGTPTAPEAPEAVAADVKRNGEKRAEDKPAEEKLIEDTSERVASPTPAPERSPVPERDVLEHRPSDEPAQPKQEQAAPQVPGAPTGGVSARSIDDKGPSMPGSAATRPGEVQRYARSVAEALSRSRPKGLPGAKGTAKISFQISTVGTVIGARIIASSGNPKLDAAAMAAVEAVKFPPPPSGMTAAQLTYEIPYHFR
jgi:protein TonB